MPSIFLSVRNAREIFAVKYEILFDLLRHIVSLSSYIPNLNENRVYLECFILQIFSKKIEKNPS